jgi:hypothetical protein
MYKENGYPVVVYLVRGKKPDPEKRPFDEDLQQAMFAKMKKQYPFLEASYVVPNGAIDTLYSAARPAYEPMMWGFGTDRKKAYTGMIDRKDYRDQLGVHPEFKGFEIKRGEENISASKVRNALKIDDEKTFKQMTPKSIHSFYKTLQNTLSPIKENNNTMKNLKSINDFGINEATVVIEESAINEAKLFDEEKNKEVKLPYKTKDFRGDPITVVGFTPPKHSGSSGRIEVKGGGEFFPGVAGLKIVESLDYNESVVNEEYIESMDSAEIGNALGKIETLWKDWRKGPLTEPSDIKPAQKELKGWIDRWFKQTIK